MYNWDNFLKRKSPDVDVDVLGSPYAPGILKNSLWPFYLQLYIFGILS